MGGAVDLNFGGSRIRCGSVAGTGEHRTATTGQTMIEFQECRERVTVLNLRCRSGRSRQLGTHIITGPEGESRVKVLGLRMAFSCADIPNFNLEGYLVGDLERGRCDPKGTEYRLPPVLFAHAQMGSGPLYDVYVDFDHDTYEIRPPWRMKFNRSVAPSC
jgi:hypothetical protein